VLGVAGEDWEEGCSDHFLVKATAEATLLFRIEKKHKLNGGFETARPFFSLRRAEYRDVERCFFYGSDVVPSQKKKRVPILTTRSISQTAQKNMERPDKN